MLLNRTGSRLMGKIAQLTMYISYYYTITSSPVSWRRPFFSYFSKVLGIDVSEIMYFFLPIL